MTPDKKAKLAKAVVTRLVLTDQLEKQLANISERELDLLAWEEVLVYLQEIARKTQEQIRFQIEEVVNLAIHAVWPDTYKFSMVFSTERNRTSVKLILREGDNEFDPLEDNGGGLVDILSISLRIALLVVSRKRKVLILDEAMKFVSVDLQPMANQMLYNVCAELGIQIIAVTHLEAMKAVAGKVYRVEKVGKYSICEEEE